MIAKLSLLYKSGKNQVFPDLVPRIMSPSESTPTEKVITRKHIHSLQGIP